MSRVQRGMAPLTPLTHDGRQGPVDHSPGSLASASGDEPSLVRHPGVVEGLVELLCGDSSGAPRRKANDDAREIDGQRR